MAYEPINWQCGDTITADKLNSIERGIAEVSEGYVPTEWECGDVITADRMNHIEQGIANAGGGGGSSDFSVKSLTFVNGDGDVVDAPYVPIYDNLTVYDRHDYTPIALGDTLFLRNSGTNGISPGESKSFNVLTYKNKLLLSRFTSDLEVVSTSGCDVDEYLLDDSGSDVVSLVTFTSDSASITIRWLR